MELIEKTLPPNHKLILFGDLHCGSRNVSWDGFHAMIDRVKRERNTYMVGMGDYIEAKVVNDPHFNLAATDKDTPTIIHQAQRVVKELIPVKDKILVLLRGNHEKKFERLIGDLTREFIADPLGANYGGYVCKLSITDGTNIKYKLFLHHGFGNVTSNSKDYRQMEGNMLSNIQRKLQMKSSDCILSAMGHTHKLLIAEPIPQLCMTDNGRKTTSHYEAVPMMPANGDRLQPHLRWYVNTGTFRRLHGDPGYDDYGEEFGYDPVDIGYAVVHVHKYEVARIEPVVI